MFKQIMFNQKETQYIICEDGIIYNTKTHKNLKGSKSNGYIYVQLNFGEGNLKSFAVHRLLAEYFIPNPEGKEIVHHIDGNPLNNNLSNLAWVTQQENCQLKHNISPRVADTRPNFSEQEIEQEIWIPFRETIYEISSLGRKKNTKTGLITCGSQNKNSGYIRWNLNGFEIQAHRAVYEAFHPNEEICVINHIDGNRANNRLNNLENLTQSENVKKSYYETRSKYTRYIAICKENGDVVDVYPSFAECARAIGVANGGVVRNALLNNFSCKGYKIKEIDLDFYREFKLKQANVT